MAGQLAGLIRSKYPGHYDDMDDDTLEAAVLSRHPEYKDLAGPPAIQPFDSGFMKPINQAMQAPAPVQTPHPEAQIGPDPNAGGVYDERQIPSMQAANMGYNPRPTSDEYDQAPAQPHEPDTKWRGFDKGLTEYFFGDKAYNQPTLQTLNESPFLQSLAHPQTKADVVNLLMMTDHLIKPKIPGLPDIVGNTRRTGPYDEVVSQGFSRPSSQAPRLPQGFTDAEIVPPTQELTAGQRLLPSRTETSPFTEEGITTQDRPSGPWDANVDVDRRVEPRRSLDDRIYDIARDKFNMGRDIPESEISNSGPIQDTITEQAPTGDSFVDRWGATEAEPGGVYGEKLLPTQGLRPGIQNVTRPTAQFIGMQPDGQGGEMPLFNVKGGPKDRSTVTLETLQQLGIETPDMSKPMARPQFSQVDAYHRAKANLDERHAAGQVVDYEEELANLDDTSGVISTMSNESRSMVNEIIKANDEGYAVIPPGGERFGRPVRTLSDGSLVVDTNPARGEEPSYMSKPVEDLPQPERTPIQPGQEREPFVRDSRGKPPADLLERFNRARYTKMDSANPNFKGTVPDVHDEFNEPSEIFGGGRRKKPAPLTSEDEQIRMEAGTREDMLRNMIGQYAEHGARVANKELVQNAIDALTTPEGKGVAGGKVNVDLNFNEEGKGPSITVEDNGPGLPIDLIKNEYITLTGSGKRGKGKYIGEMGVGKATYLLGADAFEISTVAKESDGSVWKYDFSGTPEEMITSKITVKKTQLDPSTPTGTKVTVYDKNPNNIEAAEDFLRSFSKYSNSPVQVEMHRNKYGNRRHFDTVEPRTAGAGKPVSSGHGPGADYSISVPDNAEWHESSNIAVIISNRGMFQGVDTIYLGAKGTIPDRVIVEIQPTVSATDSKNYPLTAPTRERMKDDFKNVIARDINKNLMEAAKAKRLENLQKVYDDLQPPTDAYNRPLTEYVVHDSGDRYEPSELNKIYASERMTSIADAMGGELAMLDKLFPNQLGKTTKYGFLLSDEDKGGINIPNPEAHFENREFAILVNPFGLIKNAETPGEAAQLIVHVIAHEFTHNIVRSEGAGYTWALSQTFKKFDLEEQLGFKKAILKAITGPDGEYAPELQDLLQDYTEARGRSDTKIDLLSRERESEWLGESGQDGASVRGEFDGDGASRIEQTNEKPGGPRKKSNSGSEPPEEPPSESERKQRYRLDRETGAYVPIDEKGRQIGVAQFRGKKYVGPGSDQYISPGAVPIVRKINKLPPEQVGIINQAWNASRGFMSVDLPFITSAALRQAMPMVGTEEWFKAWGPSFKSYGSTAAYEAHKAMMAADPLMHRPIRQVMKKDGTPLVKDGRPVYEETPSIIDRMKVEFSELEGFNTKEEHIRSTLAEKTPVWGAVVRASNRAYAAYINDLRLGAARNFYDAMPDKNSDVALEQIGDMINTFTGRGSLNIKIPASSTYFGKEVKFSDQKIEFGLNRYADLLGQIFWSPKLKASRLQMLNPINYTMNNPQVRKEYLKAAARTATAWTTFAMLSTLLGAKVVTDIRNSDFMKSRFGNFRLDPGAAFQQLLVLMARVTTGQYVSANDPKKVHDLTNAKGPFDPTRGSVAGNFMQNALHPTMAYFIDAAFAKKSQPFGVFDRAAQLAVPMLSDDLVQLAKENPTLFPALAPLVSAGMGGQYFKKGDEFNKPMFPSLRKYDWTLGKPKEARERLR